MQLINGKTTAPADIITLEYLVTRITALGTLRVYQSDHTKSYKVTIAFSLPSGSEIEARANNTDFAMALMGAIEEAERLRP